ncbi:MAG: class I mannose-6-phosphate isomerase [Bacillota bacterium]|nr:class I mannose-6-phosphate isomerase [Bacillota bacterium]
MLKEYIWGTEDWIHQDNKILIKVIDAKDKLSVQVHPNDEYAKSVEGQANGKNEMWYILSANEGAFIYCGFKQKVDRELVKNAALDGSIEKYLNKIFVKPGDLIKIPAGTVHAIGAGIKLLETQQNSNLTYRLYDYQRISADGKQRELHLDKALDVLYYDVYNADSDIIKNFSL